MPLTWLSGCQGQVSIVAMQSCEPCGACCGVCSSAGRRTGKCSRHQNYKQRVSLCTGDSLMAQLLILSTASDWALLCQTGSAAAPRGLQGNTGARSSGDALPAGPSLRLWPTWSPASASATCPSALRLMRRASMARHTPPGRWSSMPDVWWSR